ncbi:hypothetical protein [Lacinutrix himadriensis]|uniref:hypothetical protein n=1 Tax=Lacinutrix himadriensis TaxID=641549 RepID=UPI0006E4434B|nr:hypothetical protein [Lacinutrix himadriensis]
MKITALFIIVIFVFTSCIPTKIAPKIETYKLMVAKKFKKGLPKQNAFIFEDPKDANHFYTYINNKFKRDYIDVESNVPILIDGETYYLSFYETERETKTINLVPILVDAKREQNGNNPILESAHTSRSKGNYYLVLTVFDENLKNCLSEDYKNKDLISKHLEKIRIDYLNTYNYEELLFTKKNQL